MENSIKSLFRLRYFINYHLTFAYLKTKQNWLIWLEIQGLDLVWNLIFIFHFLSLTGHFLIIGSHAEFSIISWFAIIQRVTL